MACNERKSQLSSVALAPILAVSNLSIRQHRVTVKHEISIEVAKSLNS